MDCLINKMLWMTFFLCTLWRFSESYIVDQKTFVELNKKTVKRFRRQTEGQSCEGNTSKFQCATTTDCVNIELKCDGKKDCFDGSDEEELLCKNVSKKCTTPAAPSHGRWIYLKDGKEGIPNIKTDTKTIIMYFCNTGFKLSATNEDIFPSVCLPTGEWNTVMPTCKKLCPSLYNSSLFTLTCTNDGSVVPCDKATDNTVLSYKCKPYYEHRERAERSICYDGSWDYHPECVPVCGERRLSATPLIVGEKEVEIGNYPWVVAVYSNKESDPYFTNIGTGSLITTNIVLTAAHSVTDENGKVYNTTYYRVGAGKYYIAYNDERDNHVAQYSEVDQIEVPREYRGALLNYRGDIAMLKLKIHFAMSKVVQPVCYKNLPTVEDNNIGVVSGWGFDSTGKPSEVLKEAELLYNTESCALDLDRDFKQRYLVSDKLCFGFHTNATLCKGDSGGGAVFKNPNYKNRYFIHGVVSVIHSYLNSNYTFTCNGNALYTNVNSYIEWIELMVRKWTRVESG